MKISKRQLRRIIKEERQKLLKEQTARSDRYRYNSPPPPDSNWADFALSLDIGVLDLDNMAYDLGFDDFNDMDISISPRSLATRDPEKFVTAAQDNSLSGAEMGRDLILTYADAEGGF